MKKIRHSSKSGKSASGKSAQSRSSSAPSKLRIRWFHLVFVVLILCLVVAISMKLWQRGRSVPTTGSPTPNSNSSEAANAGQAQQPQSPEQAEIADLKQEAIRAARDLVKRHPTHPYALHIRAKTHYDLGDSETAIELWKRALNEQPNFVPSLLHLAFAAKDRGELEEAASWFDKALEQDPDLFEAQYGLAQIRISLGDFDSALKLLRADERSEPNEAGPSLLLAGQAYLELRDYEKATDYLQRASQFMPRAPAPYHSLSLASARLGNREKSAEYRKKFQDMNEAVVKARGNVKGIEADLAAARRSTAGLLTMIGNAYIRFEDAPRAERTWRLASEIDETDKSSRQALAMFYQQTQQIHKAVTTLQQLCKIEPENGSYRFACGNALLAVRQLDKAEAELAEAVRLAPSNAKYRERYLEVKNGARGSPRSR